MTLAKLTAALAKCKGGETIDATGWDIEWGRPKPTAISAPITIVGGIWRGLYVGGWKGVTFDGAEIRTDGVRDRAMRFDLSSNIHFRNPVVRGPADIPTPDLFGAAIFMDRCDDWSVTGGDFEHVHYGISWRGGNRWAIEDNDIQDIREDAIRGEGGVDARIRNNRIRTFRPQGAEHRDAIQIWPLDATPSERILIEGNKIWRGDGAMMQGIFCQAKVGHTRRSTGFIIRYNLVLGGMYNGILYDGDDGQIIDNICVGFADQRSWLDNKGARNLVERNTASWILGPKTGTLAGNTKVAENMTAEQVMALFMPPAAPPPAPVWPFTPEQVAAIRAIAREERLAG